MVLVLMLALLGQGAQPPSTLAILDRLGESAELFWKGFPAVTCDETVSQVKLGTRGQVLYSEQTVFDYLISMNFEANDIAVQESRVLKKKAGTSKNLPLLVSNGFPTLLLVFHPYYRESFDYDQQSDEVVDGRNLLRIHFRHIRGARPTCALQLSGRDYPLDIEGIAWVEPDSMSVVRIKAGLVAPMDDVGLKALSTDVRYNRFRFAAAASQWLPVTATVEVETASQHWRNSHQFSNYKRFSVDSESRIQK
jgi:hypothetical protein